MSPSDDSRQGDNGSVTAFIPAHSESFSFLPDPVSDNLIQVVIELGSAYWVMRRRMLILERLLEQGGAVTAEQIETYVPTPEETREWAALRDGFTQRVYGALTRPPAELPPGDR